MTDIQTPDGWLPPDAGARPPLVIGSDDEIARRVIEEFIPGAIFDEGALWQYCEALGIWQQVPDRSLSDWIQGWDGAEYDLSPRGEPKWIKLSAGRVASITTRIQARCGTPGYFADAVQGLAFQNGFLHLGAMRGQFVPHEKAHRARWRLPCDYGPDAARRAPPVHWVRYLRSIWGYDRECLELVHQMLGYLLSGRTDLHKMFLLLGPPRGGKGTLLNLIADIFGSQATSFKVSSLDETFGLEHLASASVAYDPDVRRSGAMYKSEGQMVERLLSISAHDRQMIQRKHKPALNVALPCRLLLAANPPFGLSDVGGALASRFVILVFPRSFLGAEDTSLGARLRAEIPSIVALALDGLEALERRGRFIEPASSKDERESVERAQNPMIGFIDDCCEVGADYVTTCKELYAAACKWREENGHRRMSDHAFGEFCRQQGWQQTRHRLEGSEGRGPRIRHGVRLRTALGDAPTLKLVR